MAESREALMDAFLAAAGWADAARETLAGDASGRRFWRLRGPAGPAVLMDAAGPDQHTAEFVVVDRLLRGIGLSAPRILSDDAANGLLLLEDFGDARIGRLLDEGGDATALLGLATDMLIALHCRCSAEAVPAALPVFDAARFLDQLCLFTETWPPFAGLALPEGAAEAFRAAWQGPLETACAAPQSLLLRDCFADNLFLLPGRQGVEACGLLDFQDAGRGPISYDLVSLLDDARRDIPEAAAKACMMRYQAAFPALDREAFARSRAVLAAVRHVRVLAVFARLIGRGREGYRAHLHRVWRLLESRLQHPELAAVRGWFDAHVPAAARPRD